MARPLPGPPGLPLLGNLLEVSRRGIIPVMLDAWRAHGDVFQLRVGSQRLVVVAHPDGVERVLLSNRANYHKGAIYDGLRVLIGEGLATAEGEGWLRRRRAMQPMFHARPLPGLFAEILRAAQALLTDWRGRFADGARVPIGEEMARLTFRIIGATLFGSDVAAETERSVEAFATAMDRLTRQADGTPKPPRWLPTAGNRRLDAALATIDAFVARMIADGRARPDEGNRGLLGVLLALRDETTGAPLSDREIRDEIVTMFLAGHETIALTLTWTLERLSREPVPAERVAAEAAALLGESPTAEESARLVYTRMVIDEALRVRCPAWIVARNCRADDEILGMTIPAGSVVLCSQFLTHRHPEFWPDPEQFRPERFDPAAPELRHDYAYYPFSRGPRICIGNTFALGEAQAILGVLLRAVKFAPARQEEYGFRPTNVLHPEPAVDLILRWR